MKNKKGRLTLIIIFVVLLVGGATFLFVQFYPGIRTGREISALLQPILNSENQSMNIDLKADISGETFDIDTQVYLVRQNDREYLAAEQNGHALYITDGVLYLENAKAFRLMDEAEGETAFVENLSNKNLFAQIAAVYEMVEITRTKEDTKTEYTASITGEQAKELLAVLVPTAEMDLSSMEVLSVKLVAEDEQLKSIQISMSTFMPNSMLQNVEETRGEAVINIDIEISDFHVLEEGIYVIPAEIELAAVTVNKEELFSLTGDLYRLLLAFGEFFEQQEIKGGVELRANCGIIQFQNTYDLEQLQMEGNGLQNAGEIKGIPEIAAFLCMEGDISCTKNGTTYVYELELQEDSMEQLAEIIVPEIVNQVISFGNGTITITIEEGQIHSMDINIGGTLSVLFSQIDAEIGAKFDFLVE